MGPECAEHAYQCRPAFGVDHPSSDGVGNGRLPFAQHSLAADAHLLASGDSGFPRPGTPLTPEMIEAGVRAYYRMGEILEPEDIVSLIYEAMAIAERRASAPA